MKKWILFGGLALLGVVAFASFGMNKKNKTEKITDSVVIEQMDAVVSAKVKDYFGFVIDPTVEKEVEAVKGFVPSPENPKEFTHDVNIFQAMFKGDPVVDELHGYGGIFAPDNKTLKGLIVNIYHERGEMKSYTEGQLTEIASRFLKDNEIIPADDTLTFVGYNSKANSDSLKIVVLDSKDQRFAVGIDPIAGAVVYFEATEIPSPSNETKK